MICPKCQSENTETARFCSNCAASLTAVEDARLSFTKTLDTPVEDLSRGVMFAGRYEIIEELGKGGMGKVFRVEDTQTREEIALKLIKPEIAADKKTLERFRNELTTARKIRHKNICGMYDLNEEKGTSYITMEYVPGEDLGNFMRRSGRLAVSKIVSIARQVCEGLSEAHGLGVVHRDLKPSNIMIDDLGNAKIMDFGIARSVEEPGITGSGIMIGTPRYMSPEQAGGEAVDERSDIYSLGVMLYEMATGEPPFKAESPLALAMKHKAEPPADPRILNLQIPEPLAQLILRCLNKDPDQRPDSAAAMKSALGLHQESIDAAATTTPSVTRAPGRKPFPRPLFYGAGVVALLILITVGYYVIKNISGAKPGLTPSGQGVPLTEGWQNSIAVLPFRDLSPTQDQEHLCYGMTEALIERLSRIGSLKVISPASAMRYKDQDKDIRTIGEELGVVNILEGSIQVEGDRIRVRGQLTDAESGFTSWTDSFEDRLTSIIELQDQVSLDIAEALKMKLVPEPPESSAPDDQVSFSTYELYIKGMNFYFSRFMFTREHKDFEDAVSMIEQALEIRPDYAEALAGLGWVYTLQFVGYGNPEDLKRAIAYAQRAYQSDPDSAFANALIGTQYLFSHEYDRVYGHLKTALSLNPNKPEVQFITGVFLRWMGLCSQAATHFQKALDLDPYSFFNAGALATAYAQCGNGEGTIKYYMQSLEINPNPPTLWVIIKMLLGNGKTQAAEDIFRRVEQENPGHEQLERARALILAKRGESAQALDIGRNYVIYALLGMQDGALDAMEDIIEKSDTDLPYLELLNMRLYDGLRDFPRFQALLAGQKRIHEERLAKFGDL
jgi:TolB-like protein/Flp pilus assembly protein TadD/predicted Ser/Thr protein kinase